MTDQGGARLLTQFREIDKTRMILTGLLSLHRVVMAIVAVTL